MGTRHGLQTNIIIWANNYIIGYVANCNHVTPNKWRLLSQLRALFVSGGRWKSVEEKLANSCRKEMARTSIFPTSCVLRSVCMCACASVPAWAWVCWCDLNCQHFSSSGKLSWFFRHSIARPLHGWFNLGDVKTMQIFQIFSFAATSPSLFFLQFAISAHTKEFQ